MATRAVRMEAKGGEPSNRIRKHQSSESEEEGSEQDEEEESDESESEQGSANRDGSISITLTDPQVLDCSICFQALTIPAYQCENGHAVCSTCCQKIISKCPTCASRAGYSRCRMIEKVLESVQVLCQNTKYGCQKAFSYSMKQKHEKSCPFVPCSCPIAECNFKASSKQLHRHFTTEHNKSAKHFRYDRLASVTLGVDENILILQEETDGSLLILNNRVETLGNVVTLSRIGPSTERSFLFELTAKDEGDRRSSLRLQSLVKSRPNIGVSLGSEAVFLHFKAARV
ncbi:hypothetical protein V6N13_072007 [Hibiscus sabdariffa]|uniref:RING-type E3 ubiquitin transferase n=1 Tax=Hibiscus sabdariffa TaxID=183260 RepID=A0ABR2TCK8_9ROSI